MHMRRFTRLVLLTVATVAALPGLASAEVILTLSQIYNGATPVGSAPWARATFTDSGANQVTLHMENLATGSSTQFITNWTFNIADESFLTGLGFAYIGDPVNLSAATTIDTIANMVASLGGGALGTGFDIGFSFEKGNAGGPTSTSRFMQGETSVYQISYTGAKTGFGASLFNATNPSGLLTSAHIQGIPTGSGGTTSGAATVPEPASLVLWSLLGVAGLGITIARRWRG
jgi:hypothetical protein